MGFIKIRKLVLRKSSKMKIDWKNHWETVYETKQPNEVSWTQENPKTSVDFIHETNLGKTAKLLILEVVTAS